MQLADRSIKVPHGVIEDVLIKVGKFMFSVNFIVQEIQPVTNLKGQITFILGRPFLATSNLVINYWNGLTKLSFGNITIDLNVFNLCKQHIDPSDEPIEMNMIQELFKVYLIDESLEFHPCYFE